MTDIEELEIRIRNLPKEDISKLRDWFHQFDDELWDQQISGDFKAGKFDKLIDKARSEFARGEVREL